MLWCNILDMFCKDCIEEDFDEANCDGDCESCPESEII